MSNIELRLPMMSFPLSYQCLSVIYYSNSFPKPVLKIFIFFYGSFCFASMNIRWRIIMSLYGWKSAAFCQDMNKALRVASDSWVMYGTACRRRGGQYRASLIWHTRGRSICNMLIHSHACSPARTHTHARAIPPSLRVRWPDRSPRLRAITGQKRGGDDRHWAFDNVSICCVCHSDSGSMLLRAWE